MKRRYKVVVNIDVDDPDESFPAGGDYMHMTRLQGIIKQLTTDVSYHEWVKVTVDKVIDKGEVQTESEEE